MPFSAVSMSQLSEIISGTLSVPTASYALFAQSASGSIDSASYSTFAETASFLLGSIDSASYALSASYADTAFTLLGSVDSASYSEFAETASFYGGSVISSSYALSSSYSVNSDGSSFWTASGADIERVSDVTIEGVFYANEKHFYIDHPTKDGMKLIYGTLEGPENAVYIRGSIIDSNTIKLPEYWNKLVDEKSITVHLTPLGKHQKLCVKNITINEITIKKGVFSFGKIACYYTIYAERKDVAKLKTEVYKK